MVPASSALQSSRRLAVPVFVAVYFLAFGLSEFGYGSLDVPSPFWLPDSVLLCALLLTRPQQWWMFVAAVAPIRLLAGTVPGMPLWFQIGSIANDAAKAVATAWLIQRWLGRDVRLRTLNELIVFFGVAAVGMPMLSAIAAAPARYALGDPVWSSTYQWFLGDTLAQVIVTPTVIYWCTRRYRDSDARLGELIVVCVGLALASSYAFVARGHTAPSPTLLYVPVPFLIWAAVRLGPFGTANAISLVAITSMIGAVRGTGVFAGAAASVLSLQLFLLVLALSLLTLAVVIAERVTLLARERDFSTLLLQAQERERTRIAHELHDDVGQRLALLKLDLHRLTGRVDGSVASIAAEAAKHADEVATSLHDLSHRLHPAKLRLLGLVPALTGLVREVSHHGPPITLTHDCVPDAIDQDITVAVFRIVQEALQNAVKHSRAGQIAVRVSGALDTLAVTVIDDGVGFIVDAAWGRGIGLISMSDRVQVVGGTLKVHSSPRCGTRLELRIPLSPARRADALAV